MIHGGSSEDDVIYTRFVEAADRGHIVTLGAVQDPGSYPDLNFWNGYFMGLGATSAETLNTETRDEALDPGLAAAIDRADAVFIRGGDQSRYVAFWRDTPVHTALLAAWQRGAVIGGSSAGAALLARPIYDGRLGSAYSEEVLRDPYDRYITFAAGMLPALENIVVDTHFTARGRLGRLAVFLLRAPFNAQHAPPIGMGVDSRTAAFIDSNGVMEVVGHGSVTVLVPGADPPILAPGSPPPIDGMGLWQFPDGYRVDLATLRSRDATDDPVLVRPAYVAPGLSEVPIVLPLPMARINGDDASQRSGGTLEIAGLEDDIDAWRLRMLMLRPGAGTWPGLIVMTTLFREYDYFENYIGGSMWTVAQHPELVVVGVDSGLSVSTAPSRQISPDGDGYAFVIDARTASYLGVPGEGWQTAALENAVLRVITAANPWRGAAGTSR